LFALGKFGMSEHYVPHADAAAVPAE